MGFQQRVTGIAALLLVVALGPEMLKGDSPGGESTIYDANPNHLWNRLNDTLFIRTGPDGVKYGYDEIDPLIWDNSQYLLTGGSHKQALAVLDEFLQKHGEKLVRDPLKRASLQHDLWFLFDWVATPSRPGAFARERTDLEFRLAELIRRLELTPQEIDSLPDNYELSRTNAALNGFADGLFKAKGDWAFLGISGDDMIAPVHAKSFGGRSTFAVVTRFPGGRAKTESYVAQLAAFTPWQVTGNLNPGLPQFPAGTEWALVRRMCIIDTNGEIRPTHLVESIQVRRYVAIRPAVPGVPRIDQPEEMADFTMNRRDNGVLRAVGTDERDILNVHFLSMGFDPFEDVPAGGPANLQRVQQKVLANCFTCHVGAGVFSVNSVDGAFSSPRLTAPPLYLTEGMEREEQLTSQWKKRQFEWGLLRGIWLSPK